tara:strand:+ start:137 stop:490 length:354 start_codon:yes stop_codon:yes gene_type:complete
MDLAEQRRKASTISPKKEINNRSTTNNQDNNKKIPLKSHQAIREPALWWSYKESLSNDLVVITPSLDTTTGLESAGDLPLAEEPKFPKAREKFLSHLSNQGAIFAQEAMIKAMSIDD